MWTSLLFGCALRSTVVGLVEPVGNVTFVVSYNGTRTPVVLSAESAPLRRLDGCVVEVAGLRAPAGLIVQDWFVRDAGDGSGGFVGTLQAYGGRITIADRNTENTVFLDDLSALQLRPYVGRPVLLIGSIVGNGVVSVGAWRLLDEAAPVEPR